MKSREVCVVKNPFRNKLGWLCAQLCDTINRKLFNLPEKDSTMSDKKTVDLKTFIENINKKDKKRNGLKIHFAFVNRKRKG